MSIIALCNCQFVQGEHVHIYSAYLPKSDFQVGLWPGCLNPSTRYADEETLREKFQDDPARKAAVAFGMLALLFGIIAMAAYWSIVCKPLTCTKKWILFILVMFAFMSQVMTLTLVRTEYCRSYHCNLAWGGVVSVTASVLWFISALGIVWIGKYSHTSYTAGDSITRVDQIDIVGNKLDCSSNLQNELDNMASASTIETVDL